MSIRRSYDIRYTIIIYLYNYIIKFLLENNNYSIYRNSKYLKDFINIFFSKSVGVLLEYYRYNYVINLKNNKKLLFKLLCNLFEKDLEVLYNYLSNMI